MPSRLASVPGASTALRAVRVPCSAALAIIATLNLLHRSLAQAATTVMQIMTSHHERVQSTPTVNVVALTQLNVGFKTNSSVSIRQKFLHSADLVQRWLTTAVFRLPTRASFV